MCRDHIVCGRKRQELSWELLPRGRTLKLQLSAHQSLFSYSASAITALPVLGAALSIRMDWITTSFKTHYTYFKDTKGKAEYLGLSQEKKWEPSFLCPGLPCRNSIFNPAWDISNINYGKECSWLRREKAKKNINCQVTSRVSFFQISVSIAMWNTGEVSNLLTQNPNIGP